MDAKSKVKAYLGGLVFGHLAVWLVFFNGYFMSAASFLSKHPGAVWLTISFVTSVVFYFIGLRAFSSRAWLLFNAVGAGLAMPAIAIFGPVLLCMVIGCSNFDMP